MQSTEIKTAWEERSRKYKDLIEGVLPKSFPKEVNMYLDDWMAKKVMAPIKAKKSKVLEIGCGYGRLAEKILMKFPSSQVVGVDVASNYVSIFNRKLSPRGKAYVASAVSLPFKNSVFDQIYIVTVLMYVVKKKEQKKVFSEIARVLKPGGKIVIIEREPFGYFLVTLGGLVSKLRGKKNREIPAVSFSPKDIEILAKSVGIKIVKKEAIPIFTLLFPVLMLIGKLFPSGIKSLLKMVNYLDNSFFFRILTPSLYISYNGLYVKS